MQYEEQMDTILFAADLGRLYKGAILKQATTARFLCLDNILCHTALFFFWGRSTWQKTKLYVNQLLEKNHIEMPELVKTLHRTELFHFWMYLSHDLKWIIHTKMTFYSLDPFWYGHTQYVGFAIMLSIIIYNQLQQLISSLTWSRWKRTQAMPKILSTLRGSTKFLHRSWQKKKRKIKPSEVRRLK